MHWSFLAGSLISLLAVLDPVGAVPAFLSVCRRERRAALVATVTVFVTLVVFAALGQWILTMFGITLPAFRAAGGVLLLLMAITMLHGQVSRVKQTPEEAEELPDRAGAAIVPLAIPLLSGPGAITVVMVQAHDAVTWPHRVGLLIVIFFCSLTVYATLSLAGRLQARLGQTGINIFNRVMGLILAAVGMQFIGDGLRELLPGLGA